MKGRTDLPHNLFTNCANTMRLETAAAPESHRSIQSGKVPRYVNIWVSGRIGGHIWGIANGGVTPQCMRNAEVGRSEVPTRLNFGALARARILGTTSDRISQ